MLALLLSGSVARAERYILRLRSLIFTTQKSRYHFSHFKNEEADALQRLSYLPSVILSIKYVRSYWSNLGDSWHKGSRWKFSDKYRGAKMY